MDKPGILIKQKSYMKHDKISLRGGGGGGLPEQPDSVVVLVELQ
jgi:hypothetical protein